ncbi:D-arabinono-1,4-lactone oxidase [Claviceps citrina]|nr:D-arabinono-1,4-lactone oxidase [Claviceps citrina]
MHPIAEAELQGPNADGVPFRARPHHVHRTWAGTFSSLPELYIQPETLAEVEKAVSLARRCRRRIVTTGCGHSPSDLTCTSSWMVNLDRFGRILSVDAATGVVVMESGIRLYALCEALERHGLAMPNLGSINQQSIAGAISTGTHGSSLRHGLMSEDVLALAVTLADGTTEACSAESNPELFRAALLSLGALGIITQVAFRAVPAFTLRWTQTVDADRRLFEAWPRDLWTRTEFVRVWWLPYTRRAVVWQADKTATDADPERDPPRSYYDGTLGYCVYHSLLYAAHFAPRMLPWVEWFVFGMQYGFANGSTSSAVQPSRKALLLNCLYSQFVNEWAIPLHKGPEALRRLSTWLNHLTPDDPDYMAHGIPFSAAGLHVHAPLEVRVSDTTLTPGRPRPYLDPTVADGPTLYLNATLYRPYGRDPPCRRRYYEAFEWLMRDLGGRPHWAKNFDTSRADIEAMYGQDLQTYRALRDRLDPEGMFVGPWHRERVLADVGAAAEDKLPLEEVEVAREKASAGGLMTWGRVQGR